MKQIITICFLLASTGIVNAQKLTFEETVNYINTFFKENKVPYYIKNGSSSKTGRYIKGISADKTGKIIIYDRYKGEVETDKMDVIWQSINLFDINKYTYSSEELILEDAKGNYFGFFGIVSEAQAGRLERALLHLRSFCNKDADPFAN